MNYELFKETISRMVKEQCSADTQVEIQTIAKNNGITKEALTILGATEKLSPSIYLEPYYERYLKGIPLTSLLNEVLAEYQQNKIVEMKAEHFTDFAAASSRICYKVINHSCNTGMLDKLPHVKMLNLAIVFYYKVADAIATGATILIHEKHRQYWGISLEELHQLAQQNTASCLPAVFQTVQQLLGEGMEESLSDAEEVPMYVLTNSEKYLGAGCFLYPGLLKQIAEIIQSDFYILPSSIHETIIMPVSGQYSTTELNELVREMNKRYIEKEEFLSDDIYYYHGQEEKLVMA